MSEDEEFQEFLEIFREESLERLVSISKALDVMGAARGEERAGGRRVLVRKVVGAGHRRDRHGQHRLFALRRRADLGPRGAQHRGHAGGPASGGRRAAGPPT